MTTFSKSIASGVNTFGPLGVAQSRAEDAIIVNGMQRGWKWNRRSASAVPLGVDYPQIGQTVTAAAGGAAEAGDYIVGYRWLDKDLQPGSLSPTNSVTATANQRFYYSTFQEAPSTRVTDGGFIQLFRSAVDATRIMYTVYGTGPAFSISATANDAGYSQYTVGDVTGLKPGDVVVVSGHSNSRQDGQQTILKVVDDDNTLTTDKGFVASGTGTATQRHFYFAYSGSIASHADSGGSVQFTTSTPHRLALGAVILVSGSGVGGYNTTHKVRSISSPFVFVTDQSFSAGTLGSSTVWRTTGFGNSTDNNDGDELSDTSLTASTNIALSILDGDGSPLARRFNPPPKHKRGVVFHEDRAWYFGDVAYGGTNAAGQTMSVAVTQGDYTVTGTNTAFNADMVGRYIYIDGETLPRIIQKYTSATVIEVDGAIARANGSGLAFKITPPPDERNKVYYCVDESTEMLTERGWMRWIDVQDGEMALTLNPQSRQIEWQPISKVNVFAFDGQLNHWKSERIDALTTDNHRWLADGCGVMGGHWSLRKGLGKGNAAHFTTTEESQGMTSKRLLTSGGTPPSQEPDCEITDDLVELCGWYITEGTNGTCGFFVSQSWKHNSHHCRRIGALADRLRSDVGGTVTACKPQRSGEIQSWYFGKGVGEAVRRLCPDKSISPEFLRRLTADQLEILYVALMDGDGHRGKHGHHIWSQKDRGRLDGFQMLCAMLGKRTHLRFCRYKTQSGEHDMGHVGVYKPRYTSPCDLESAKERYVGPVWCPTTPNGTWMARRNGFTYWTGNSHELEPESVPATNVVYIDENAGDNDEIVGMIPHGTVLYAVKDRHTYRISYARQPKIDATPTLAFSRGALNHRCLVTFEDDLYALDAQGIYRVPLWGSDHLSRDGVQHEVRPLLDFVYDNKLGLDKARWAFGAVDAERRQVRFFLPTSAFAAEYAYDTTLLRPKVCICLNLDTQTWDIEGYVHQLGGGCLVPVNGRLRSFLGGQRDLVYAMEDDLTESVGSVLRGTVAAYTAGTPSIQLASDPGVDLDGAPVCIIDGTGKFQVRRAVSRSGAVVTLDQAYTTAPTTSSTYMVGGVLCRARTGQFAHPDSSNSKKGEHSNKRGFRIAYQPFSDTFDVRFYKNHASAPVTHTIPVNHGAGITLASAAEEYVVDATLARSSHGDQPGYAFVEIAGGRLSADSYGDRWLGVELRCVRGTARPKFYGSEIVGVIPHPGAGKGD